jgi:hypothetical protein
MTLSPLPPESPFWFPVAPGVTTLPTASETVENEYPQPANSIPVEDDFDPQNPPSDLWDILPTDTPAVPETEIDVDRLVPVVKLDIKKVFVSRTTVDVDRGLIRIPETEDLTLIVRTSAAVKAVRVKNVVPVVKTQIFTVAGVPSLRFQTATVCNVLSYTHQIVEP